jgi:hypothetical protein
MTQGLWFSIAMMGLSTTDIGIKMIYVFFVEHNNTAVGTWTLKLREKMVVVMIMMMIIMETW